MLLGACARMNCAALHHAVRRTNNLHTAACCCCRLWAWQAKKVTLALKFSTTYSTVQSYTEPYRAVSDCAKSGYRLVLVLSVAIQSYTIYCQFREFVANKFRGGRKIKIVCCMLCVCDFQATVANCVPVDSSCASCVDIDRWPHAVQLGDSHRPSA